MILPITFFVMTVTKWLRLRGVELGAAAVTAALLIGGLAAGVPFLLDRIPEVFFYSVCCVAAVVLHATLDLAGRGLRAIVRRARPAAAALPERTLVRV